MNIMKYKYIYVFKLKLYRSCLVVNNYFQIIILILCRYIKIKMEKEVVFKCKFLQSGLWKKYIFPRINLHPGKKYKSRDNFE